MAQEVDIYTALSPSQIPQPLAVVYDADIYSLPASPNYLRVVFNARMYSPVPLKKQQKYLMRCKNLATSQWVYWLSDGVDASGVGSGLPMIDVSDVCLIEVVDL